MGMLAVGAGAGEGLETLLARLMKEDAAKRQESQFGQTLAETTRSHKAEEGLRGRQIDDSAANRQMQIDTTRINQENLNQDRDQSRIMGAIKLRPIGGNVTVPERTQEMAAGAPSALYGDEAPGDFPANGDSGPPMPKIPFVGTQDQQMAVQKEHDLVTQQGAANTRADQVHADAMTNAAATREAAKASRDQTASFQNQSLELRRQALADKQAGSDVVKLGEGGKRSLRSIDQAAPLINQIMKNFPADIEDPNAKADPMGTKINPKYNTWSNKIGNVAEYAQYKAGFYDPNSPMIQLEKLLQPVQVGQYMAGSRSHQMLELAMAHLSDPMLTDAERYSRLKTLRDMMPELRQAVIQSEAPVHANSAGQVTQPGAGSHAGAGPTVPTAGGDVWTYDPATKKMVKVP